MIVMGAGARALQQDVTAHRRRWSLDERARLCRDAAAQPLSTSGTVENRPSSLVWVKSVVWYVRLGSVGTGEVRSGLWQCVGSWRTESLGRTWRRID